MPEFARFRGRQVEILEPVKNESDFESQTGRKLNKAAGEKLENFVWTLDGGRRRLRTRAELGLDENRVVRTENRRDRDDDADLFPGNPNRDERGNTRTVER